MSNATRRQLDASPRRHVRWIYLLSEWPDAKNYDDYCEAILAAPPEAVIAALAREVNKYSEVITNERQRRVDAEAELQRLREAVALVLGLATRLAAPLLEQLQLDLGDFEDDGRPAEVDVPVGQYL